jgi:NAD-dependent dihydropyrimidine dehydrogenase PreA subunit
LVISQSKCENTRGNADDHEINEPCIASKDASCVEACPVDCIHPTPGEPDFEAAEQLYIDPEECIDRDACVSRTALCRRGSVTALIAAAAAT